MNIKEKIKLAENKKAKLLKEKEILRNLVKNEIKSKEEAKIEEIKKKISKH